MHSYCQSTSIDSDLDGRGDACEFDADGDGISDETDGVRSLNDDQIDIDADGLGDKCDSDRDGDLVASEMILPR